MRNIPQDRYPIGDIDSSARVLKALGDAARARRQPGYRWVSTEDGSVRYSDYGAYADEHVGDLDRAEAEAERADALRDH